MKVSQHSQERSGQLLGITDNCSDLLPYLYPALTSGLSVSYTSVFPIVAGPPQAQVEPGSDRLDRQFIHTQTLRGVDHGLQSSLTNFILACLYTS